jgi:hypothetical protein
MLKGTFLGYTLHGYPGVDQEKRKSCCPITRERVGDFSQKILRFLGQLPEMVFLTIKKLQKEMKRQ